jgi:SAM-dependent MidA family methyltransferase
LAGWIAALANVLESGLVLLVDYGFPRHEYYHAQRAQGTLMCHYRHRAHDDPFVYPGLQDITAHVDFTALAEAAVQAGLDVGGYCAQAHFLLSCQLDKMVAACDPQDPAYLAITQQVRTLTSPEEMGELFKVIALTKSLSTPLMGFSFRDQREKL